MATEVPATDHPGRDRHYVRTLILAGAVLLFALSAVGLAVSNAAWLNHYWFLHFPLGFYFLAQGVPIFLVVLAFWFARAQERIDRARAESEELE